jgi:hypothetical protein
MFNESNASRCPFMATVAVRLLKQIVLCVQVALTIRLDDRGGDLAKQE